jgi:hypothetical protein
MLTAAADGGRGRATDVLYYRIGDSDPIFAIFSLDGHGRVIGYDAIGFGRSSGLAPGWLVGAAALVLAVVVTVMLVRRRQPRSS